MALGGGLWTTQNKKLPGTYAQFTSAQKASATLSERGIVTMAMAMDWGETGKVITIENGDFLKNSLEILGYEYGHAKLKPLREVFQNAKTVLLYRLNNAGVKASCTYATAKCAGVRGNDLAVVITKNVDDATMFDVATVVGTTIYDVQTVKTAGELVDNAFLVFKKEATLAETAKTPLTNGTNGEAVATTQYQAYLDAIESYSFNAMGCAETDETIKGLFTAYTKRMRDEIGAKFQCVTYKNEGADYEGVVSVENKVLDDTNEACLVYYTLGLIGGCAINKSNTNHTYKGEYEVDVNYTQTQLAKALEEGKFIYHMQTGEIRVLEDINTFTSITDEKGIDFASNQTIRVIDQINNDTAVIFNDKYLGKVPNNEAGRISLYNDVVALHMELQTLQAIENFKAEDITIAQGNTKKAVLMTNKITPVNAMAQLYLQCVIM